MVKEISILMTALNVDELLHSAIKSIAENDFPKSKYELVVVHELDNHSKKNEILKDVKKWGIDARIIKIESTRHIGFNRRKLVEFAKYKYLLFTDADCVVPRNWINIMYNEIESVDSKTAAVMGSVKVPRSTFIGDCISSLGFPGGAFLGFEKMFFVDSNGYTNQISTGNIILRQKAVKEVGSFSLVSHIIVHSSQGRV
ncbi:MAG: glycosyltransferase family A protein [Candidatus Aenigmatarchaeota archaeon]